MDTFNQYTKNDPTRKKKYINKLINNFFLSHPVIELLNKAVIYKRRLADRLNWYYR